MSTRTCAQRRKDATDAPAGVSFGDLCRLAECAGFERDRIAGTCHVYVRVSDRQVLPLHDERGRAHASQVLKVLDLFPDEQ